MPTLYTVIRRPLITEKGMTVKETQNTLVFEVALKATKTEVKQAVESLFKVKVTGVRTATVEGKERRRGKFCRLPPRLEEGLRSPQRWREDAGIPQQPLSEIFSPQQNSGTEALLSNQPRRQGNKDDADQIISTDYSITPLRDEARQRRHHDGQAA